MKNILLLNPPWINNRLIRGGYCGHIGKGAYTWPPVDLLMISGILAEKHKVSCLDCIAENLDCNKCHDKISKIKPDIIIALTSAISFKEDIIFLGNLKRDFGCMILLTGETAYFECKLVMETYQFIDGIIFNYMSDFILKFIDSDFKNLKDLAYRREGKIILTEKSKSGEIDLPIPKHELFPFKKYSIPYAQHYPIAFTFTTYGCPFCCSFCSSGKIPYMERGIKNVISELKYLESLGIKEIVFVDSAFNGNTERCKALCNAIIKEKLNLKWCCELMIINSNAELLKLLKKAGCHFVSVGLESADDIILKEVHKPLTTDKTIKFFRLCKKIGLNTLGHFILGLPSDTKESINRTIEFSKKVGCDYASFNIYIPRMGTDLRKSLTEYKKIKKEDLIILDCFKEDINTNVSKKELLGLKNKAIKEFYFRPSQIIKQILLIRTWTQLYNLVKNGHQIFLDIFSMNKK